MDTTLKIYLINKHIACPYKEVHPHLSIIVFDNLQVKEVILVLSTKGGVPASSLRNLKLVLGAQVFSWWTDSRKQTKSDSYCTFFSQSL